MSGSSINAVFYAESYHPIQAGSIDGTDIAPHDNAVYRALLCSSAGLYDALGDPKLIGDPYCTVFVGRLAHFTTEETLRKAMGKYGRVKNLRLVRDIVTGSSRGYAFVEFETEREMRRAYKDAHHSLIDDSEITVDYSRQQLMPGWIPRRLGGGLGGKKESGQLRFGGRERPFRAPLKPVPFDELKRLGIPPPDGRYMSRFQVPSPPRRKWSPIHREESSQRWSSIDNEERYRSQQDMDKHSGKKRNVDKEEHFGRSHSVERQDHKQKGDSIERSEHLRTRISLEREDRHWKRSSGYTERHHGNRSPQYREEPSIMPTDKGQYSKRGSNFGKESSHKSHKHERRSSGQDRLSNY